jgi:hypothetical protein
MNTTSLLNCLFLGALVNLLHWRGHKEERWLYFPQRGWPKVIANGAVTAIIFASVASDAGWMAPSTGPLIIFPLTSAHQLYSIWIRQTQRRKKA